MQGIKNITELSNELTYHRYMLGQGQVQNLFQDIAIPEYIALHRISHSINAKNDCTDRTYLKDIADELRLTVPKASKMVGSLRDKGLVSWSHDGNGSEGTYITITDSGIRLMEKQEAFLKEYYSRVIEKFGEKKLVALFSLMEELESVMDKELNEKGEND